MPANLAGKIADDMTERLQGRDSEVGWQVETVADALVTAPADDAAIVEAARERLLAHDWNLAVCLTDLPLHVAHRPVVAHASPLHAVAVLSVPALGTLGIRRPAADACIRLVDALLGQPQEQHHPSATEQDMTPSRQKSAQQLADLGTDDDDTQGPAIRGYGTGLNRSCAAARRHGAR
jgi:hypothetical protein